MSKLLVIVAMLLVAFGDGMATIVAIHEDNYSQVALSAILSFLFFHLAVMAIKIGLMPWRVVPTFFLIAGMSCARGIDFAFDGEGLRAFGQFITCVVWAITAKKANATRLLIKAEQK